MKVMERSGYMNTSRMHFGHKKEKKIDNKIRKAKEIIFVVAYVIWDRDIKEDISNYFHMHVWIRTICLS